MPTAPVLLTQRDMEILMSLTPSPSLTTAAIPAAETVPPTVDKEGKAPTTPTTTTTTTTTTTAAWSRGSRVLRGLPTTARARWQKTRLADVLARADRLADHRPRVVAGVDAVLDRLGLVRKARVDAMGAPRSSSSTATPTAPTTAAVSSTIP
jgi:hypothetical protein